MVRQFKKSLYNADACVYIYASMCEYVCLYVHVCVRAWMCVCVGMCWYVFYMCMHACLCKTNHYSCFIYAELNYIGTYIYTYMYIYVHILVHAVTQVRVPLHNA